MLKSYHSNSWNQYYYLKAYHNLGSETQKIQILTETMVVMFKKRFKRYFLCGHKTPLKDYCSNKHTEKVKTIKKTSRNLPSLP